MSTEKPYKYVEIANRESFEVIKRLDVSGFSEAKIMRLEQGVASQTNLKEFFVRVQSYEIDMKPEKAI